MTMTRGSAILCSLTLLLVSCGGGGGSGSPQSNGPPSGGGNPPAAQNRPPMATGPARTADEVAVIGFAYSYDVSVNGTAFRDPDGDVLSYEVSVAPTSQADACELSSEGSRLKGTPTKTGRCSVQVFVRDGRGGELGVSFLVNQEFNQPPTVARPNPNTIVATNASIDYDATQAGTTFVDPEKAPLTYEVSILDAPAGFAVRGTRITGRLPGPGYAKVKITASDGFGGATEDSFAFIVPSAISTRPVLPATPYVYADRELPLPENMIQLGDKLGSSDTASAFNPVTNAGAALGRVLFYDKRLSITNTHACASCHIQSHNFSSIEVLPKGCTGVRTPRTPMPLGNVRFNNSNLFFADSRGQSLENAVLVPIQERDELGSSSLNDLEHKLASTDYYPPLFLAAFGSSDVTAERISHALAQFLRSLISYRSQFDRANYAILPGPRPDPATVYTALEQRGFQVYLDGQCFWCHQTSEFDAPWPENNGLDAASTDKEPGARKFRVASLRNIAVSAPYMHDGRFATLREVIDHYSTDIRANPNLGVFLKPGGFNFTDEDKDALEAFLNTLTDTAYLTDPKFSDPFQ